MKFQTNSTIRDERRKQSLRTDATDVEHRLWQHLRARQMLGTKFRRQHAIGNYIVDFVAMDVKLVVELDGSQHAAQTEYDQARDQFLTSLGFKVLRFWNNDVTENLTAVLESIHLEISKKQTVTTPSPPQPSP